MKVILNIMYTKIHKIKTINVQKKTHYRNNKYLISVYHPDS